MTNPKMDAIQVQDTVMSEKRTLSPGFILLGESLVETAHRTGTRHNSHQRFSDFSHFMSTGATHKHLRQCFRHLRFIALVAFEDLTVKCTFSISGHVEILNASGQ